MSQQQTLLEFLEAAGNQVRAYDMGRRIEPLDRELLLDVEQARRPYPLPLQQQAWIGLALQPADLLAEPVIWFLRLPLDERGLLQQSARDYFVRRLIDAAGKPEGEALKDNPHVFKPRDDRLAIFHARLSVDLEREPSRFYEHARDYFSGKPGWDQWSFVGYQGIADVAVRLGEEDNSERVAAAIAELPQTPLQALCHCLENIAIPDSIAHALLARAKKETDPDNQAALLRAISGNEETALRKVMIGQLLNGAANPQVLAAVAARCWQDLRDGEMASRYLEALAGADPQLFTACLSDLLFIPGMREPLLGALRDPGRSEQLAAAFGRMMGQG